MIFIGNAQAVNFNQAGDTPIPVSLPSGYFITSVLIGNLSAAASGGVYSLFSGPGQTGTRFFGVGGSTLKGPGTVTQAMPYPVGGGTPVETGSTLYFNVGTANGAPLTGDVWVFGELWPPVVIQD